MTIEAKIICDSVGPNEVRITTFVLQYPRFIHAEVLTHRALSRNASSSRAIPFQRQLKMIEEDMAMPLEFRMNQPGMQAGALIKDQDAAKIEWLNAGVDAIQRASKLAAMGVHKQYVNRLLEPFAHITVVVTATEWANFFALRYHEDAQPEIAQLAKQMWEAYTNSSPKKIKAGEWHLPFIGENENTVTEGLIKYSVARCARVSYLNHDGSNPDPVKDLELYDRLLGSELMHASPFEHQAQALNLTSGWMPWSGNFRGWLQYRKTLLNENIKEFKGPAKEPS